MCYSRLLMLLLFTCIRLTLNVYPQQMCHTPPAGDGVSSLHSPAFTAPSWNLIGGTPATSTQSFISNQQKIPYKLFGPVKTDSCTVSLFVWTAIELPSPSAYKPVQVPYNCGIECNSTSIQPECIQHFALLEEAIRHSRRRRALWRLKDVAVCVPYVFPSLSEPTKDGMTSLHDLK